MEIRKDIFGVEAVEGDIIVYNPPYYKGLQKTKVVGFSNSGLPKVVKIEIVNSGKEIEKYHISTPKTGFVIIR